MGDALDAADALDAEDVLDVFVLLLRPRPHVIPAAVRVRRALKTLLRCYDLRCVCIRWPLPEELLAADGADREGSDPAPTR